MRETMGIDRSHATISKDRRTFLVIQISKQKRLLLTYAVFVLLVLFEPDYFTITSFHLFFQMAKYFVAVLTIFVFIVRKVKLNGLLIRTTIFEGLLMLSTFTNNSDVWIWVKNCAYIIVLMLFVQTAMEQDARSLLLALSIVLGLYTHINSICRVIYPLGMYPPGYIYQTCWLFGYDNCAGIIILLAITVTLFRILYFKDRFLLWDWSVLLSGCWFILIQRMATSMFAGTCFFAIIFASGNERIRKTFAKGTLVITVMFLLFFLIQFGTALISKNFSFIFTALGKDGTFTGRVRIWSIAWQKIKDGGWLLGRGQQTIKMYQGLFGGRGWGHLHCYYLQVIYEGGFLALAALFGVLIYVAARFDKGKYGHTYMPFLAGLLAIMLMWQVEAYVDLVKYGFVILSLMYNTPLLVQSEEVYNPKRFRFRLAK